MEKGEFVKFMAIMMPFDNIFSEKGAVKSCTASWNDIRSNLLLTRKFIDVSNFSLVKDPGTESHGQNNL